MASRKQRDMTDRQDGLLGAVNPFVLPGPDKRTKVVLRGYSGPSTDIAIESTGSGLNIYQDPDGANTLVATVPASGGASAFGGLVAFFVNPAPGDSLKTLLPFTGTITGWKAWGGDSAGSVEFDVRVVNFVDLPPEALDSIVGATPPSIASDISDTGLVSDWDTALVRGEGVEVVISSVATFSFVCLLLEVTK